MKTLLILSVIFCVAPSIRAATVVPAEAAAVLQEDKDASKPEVDAVDGAAVLPQGDDLMKLTERMPRVCNAVIKVRGGNFGIKKKSRFTFCLGGWLGFRGKCYYLVNHANTWRKAESFCAGFDGSLASVHDIWEYSFLQTMVKTGGHNFAWIGGYHFQGDWRWEDGSAFGYDNWEGMSSTSQYQCLLLNSQESKGWSNHDCSMSFPFVCQVKPGC